ncbi:MAG: hypothetical protein RJA70_3975 [Pseudomonadota bacterium]|jgi:hypothetical protein
MNRLLPDQRGADIEAERGRGLGLLKFTNRYGDLFAVEGEKKIVVTHTNAVEHAVEVGFPGALLRAHREREGTK